MRGSHLISASNWRYSRIGIGGYRLATDNHQAAIEHALEKGLQVIDTSSHFEEGLSEQVIGKAIEKYLQRGIKRENLFIMSKAGFVYSSSLPESPATFQVGPQTYHSLSPSFLRQELLTSLKRTKLDHLDCFLINNPERCLADIKGAVTLPRLYDCIHKAFDELEKCVASGHIKSYGICSTSMTLPTAPDHIHLSELISSRFPHFRLVQYPLNLYEHSAMDSVSALAQRQDMVQIAHRPLNVLLRGRVHTLRTRYSRSRNVTTNDISRSLGSLFQLESDLASALDDVDPSWSGKFLWADILSENISSLLNNLFAATYYFKRKMLPQVDQDSVDLVNALSNNPEALAFVTRWIPQYKESIHQVVETALDVCEERDKAQNQQLLEVIQSCLTPQERADPGSDNLATLAIRFTASLSPVCSVLVGMHTPVQVDDAVTASHSTLSQETINRILDNPYMKN